MSQKMSFFFPVVIEKTKTKGTETFLSFDCLSISFLAWCCMIDHEGSKVVKNYITIKIKYNKKLMYN